MKYVLKTYLTRRRPAFSIYESGRDVDVEVCVITFYYSHVECRAAASYFFVWPLRLPRHTRCDLFPDCSMYWLLLGWLSICRIKCTRFYVGYPFVVESMTNRLIMPKSVQYSNSSVGRRRHTFVTITFEKVSRSLRRALKHRPSITIM